MRRILKPLAVAAVVMAAAACEGTWSTASSPSPVRAIHAALMHTGKVLLIAGSGNDPTDFAAGTFKTAVYDPTTDTFDANIPTPYDLFCGGHAFLPDGRLLVVGGTAQFANTTTGAKWNGEKRTTIFDPVTQTYAPGPTMAIGRWYPSVFEKGDGKLVALAGYDENGNHSNTFQVFDPATSTFGPNTPIASSGVGVYSPLYPSFHLMANGKAFYSGAHAWGDGPGTSPYIWDMTTNTPQWLPNNSAISVDQRDQGASVLLPPAQDQKVMVIGGSGTATTAIIDLKQSNPAYVAGPPITEGKQYVSAVILPDGRVLETGGTSAVREDPNVVYRHSTEIYDPKANTWTKAADQPTGRSYHSGAMLLPDGRVLTFGGNPLNQPFEMTIGIFSPGYMTKVRPTITSAPTNITWGTPFSITTDTAIGGAVLIRPSAVTHSSDSDQRSVDLAVNGSQLTVPANHNITPPGWYMLFVRDASGVPSVAKWVQVS
jgi:hypothetical protein